MAQKSQWKNYLARELVTDDGNQIADDIADALRVLPVSRELTVHPFGLGDLTIDGVQYSTNVNTSTANVNVNIEVVNVAPLENGSIKYMEFGLTAEYNCISNATANLNFAWQGRNDGVDWVDLHSEIQMAPPGTTMNANTVSGYFEPTTNFNALPCQLRLIIACNDTDEGNARTKNSSYFKVLYEPN